jgi:hypothetical protein
MTNRRACRLDLQDVPLELIQSTAELTLRLVIEYAQRMFRTAWHHAHGHRGLGPAELRVI